MVKKKKQKHWIKDDRVWLDKKIQKKEKIGSRIEMVSFLSFFLKIYCACIESWWIRHFCAQHVISYFSYHACIHHTRHQVKYLMPNSFPRVRKYERSIGSSDQYRGTRPRGVWTRDLRDQERTCQVGKADRTPHWSKGRASSRVPTLSDSTIPSFWPASKSSTKHPDRKQRGLSP